MAKAFVGHSFTDDDKNLVLSVTEFLEAFKGSNSAFSWTHAEAARPEDIVDKVLPMLRSCDIFVGICSKKERVASPVFFRRSFWTKTSSVIDESKLQWKTSDWIIQEIAIARDREMHLVLLLEEGVRPPGGLHGNVEYITFQRENMSGAYVRLTQMLGVILARGNGTQGPDSKTTQPEMHRTEEQPEQKNDPFRLPPQASWQPLDYYMGIFHAVLFEDDAYLETVRVAYVASDFGLHDHGLAKWKARKEYSLLVLDKGGSVGEFEKMVNQHRSDPEMVSMLARVLSHFNDERGAAKLLEEAARAAIATKDFNAASRNLLSAVEIACKARDEKEARRLIQILAGLPSEDREAKEVRLRAVALLAKFKDHSLMRIAALEYQVSIDPTDADKRFSLAYAYSETDDVAATLMHYLAIPDARRTEIAWNNLAVARQALKLPVLAIDAYQVADSKANSLAMSNLAQAYIKAGFYSEAEAMCKKGMDSSDPHENLPSTYAQIKASRGEEKKIEDAAVVEAEPRSRVMQEFGAGTLGTIKSPLPTRWTGPEGPLTLAHIADAIVINGRYVQQQNALSRAIGLFNVQDTYELTIKGTIYGRTVVGTIERKKQGEAPSSTALALGLNTPTVAIFLFSEDCRTIYVVENSGKNSRRFAITAADS